MSPWRAARPADLEPHPDCDAVSPAASELSTHDVGSTRRAGPPAAELAIHDVWAEPNHLATFAFYAHPVRLRQLGLPRRANRMRTGCELVGRNTTIASPPHMSRPARRSQ